MPKVYDSKYFMAEIARLRALVSRCKGYVSAKKLVAAEKNLDLNLLLKGQEHSK